MALDKKRVTLTELTRSEVIGMSILSHDWDYDHDDNGLK